MYNDLILQSVWRLKFVKISDFFLFLLEENISGLIKISLKGVYFCAMCLLLSFAIFEISTNVWCQIMTNTILSEFFIVFFWVLFWYKTTVIFIFSYLIRNFFQSRFLITALNIMLNDIISILQIIIIIIWPCSRGFWYQLITGDNID